MKRRTIGEVARLARVSVRALHHWDEIGLVVPSGRSPKGYRLYTDRDLEKLEVVLVHRALGLALDEIARIVADPAFDRARALRTHRDALARRIEVDRALLALVDRAISEAEGTTAMKTSPKSSKNGEGLQRMTPEERIRAFGAFEPEAHEGEVQERWGHTDAYAESQRRTRGYGPREWETIRAQSEEIERELCALFTRGVSASSAEAIALAERHRAHIERWFYACPPEIHTALARGYVEDPRFAAHYDRRRAGLGAYVRDAILARHGA